MGPLAGDSPEQEKILNIMNYSQRGRMDDQRCTLDPTKPAQKKNTSADSSNDDFFQTLANMQGHRLDDQRLTLASLPGFNQQSHRDDAPQSLSTPDTNKKLLSVPASPVQIASHRDPSTAIQVCYPNLLLGAGQPKLPGPSCIPVCCCCSSSSFF
uniref:Purkinje cell protein 2 n=1 Tax=Myripristis murdjan TaxID=586833 RepID=A0A667ZKQ5_9TELE